MTAPCELAQRWGGTAREMRQRNKPMRIQAMSDDYKTSKKIEEEKRKEGRRSLCPWVPRKLEDTPGVKLVRQPGQTHFEFDIRAKSIARQRSDKVNMEFLRSDFFISQDVDQYINPHIEFMF
ncbi:hypothetical protein RUM44_007754 [Polyplax serrata]|uniref:Uncharacterized protein n=1 Tax=Polyplax serrata TaxID=468196 RepID=A0ABR1BAD6_POLSC